MARRPSSTTTCMPAASRSMMAQTKLVLVIVDSCVIQRSIFDEAKKLVHEATGLPMENMLMSATHSHSCGTVTAVGQSTPDPAYQKFVARRIADGVRCALNNLAPAKIGWGFGRVPQHVFNRRWRLTPGTVPVSPLGVANEQVKTNPGIKNPNLDQPAGPTDPQVWFISVQSPEGRPIALYANYSLHYVGGVGAGHISADYYGAFRGPHPGTAGRGPAGSAVRGHDVERHERRHQQHRLPRRPGEAAAVWPDQARRE